MEGSPPSHEVRGLLDALPLPAYLVEGERSVLLENAAARELWGKNDAGGEHEPVRAALVSAATPGPEEIHVPTSARGPVTVLRYARPIGAATTRSVVLHVDVTEQRAREHEAERRAREEHALRMAAHAVSELFTIQDVVAEVAHRAIEATRAESAFVERIDIASGEIELVATSGRWSPPAGLRLPYEGSLAQRVIEGGVSVLVEDAHQTDSVLLRQLADSCGPCVAMVVPLRDSGEPIGALILVRGGEGSAFDRQDVERAEVFGDLAALAFRKIHLLEESERRRVDVERITESRTRLIRGFSHDLKNTIGAADGYVALMEEGMAGPLTESQSTFVGRLRRQIRAALALLEDLGELHQVEAGQIPIQRAPLELADLVHEMTEAYRPQARAKGLGLEVAIRQPIPVIESDASRIRQVLGNLISNAVKYTRAGGVTVCVEVRTGFEAAPDRSWVCVDVTDTGPGIPADQQHLLFREFTRLDPEAAEGVGLGLAISQRIAAALDGGISLESEPGRGSTFTLALPSTGRLEGVAVDPEGPLRIDDHPAHGRA